MDDLGRIEQLYVRHASAVTAYALRRTDRATAEEAVGEVFLIAWRRRDVVGDDELAWLLGTARRVLANARRGRLRQVALQTRIAAQPPAWAVDAPDSDWPVLRALAGLSERDREAILLVAWDELDAGRAAQVLGVRQRTFEARLYRARQRLARALTEEEPICAPAVGNAVVKEHA
jgi:RNA polymerase sigma factor (sigma-70 family)